MSKKKKIFKRPSKNLENQSIPLKKKKKNYKTWKQKRKKWGTARDFCTALRALEPSANIWSDVDTAVVLPRAHAAWHFSLQAMHPPTLCNSRTNVLDYIEKWFDFLELNGWRWTDWFSLGFIFVFNQEKRHYLTGLVGAHVWPVSPLWYLVTPGGKKWHCTPGYRSTYTVC